MCPEFAAFSYCKGWMKMGKAPSFQFYPNDWLRDMMEYSLEIRGAWITILCKLWWSETRGKLSKTLHQWSLILGESPERTKDILFVIKEEKIGNISVINSNPNTIITVISRRMARDEKDRENNRLRQAKHYDKTKPNANLTSIKQKPNIPSSTSSSSPTSIPPSKKEVKSGIYIAIFNFWNKQKIIVHRDCDDNTKRKINKSLKSYPKEDIAQAIVNYANVLKSNTHYFKHKWTLEDFLQRGLKKFLPEADPINNFRTKEDKSNYEQAMETLEKWTSKDRDDGLDPSMEVKESSNE